MTQELQPVLEGLRGVFPSASLVVERNEEWATRTLTATIQFNSRMELTEEAIANMSYLEDIGKYLAEALATRMAREIPDLIEAHAQVIAHDKVREYFEGRA